MESSLLSRRLELARTLDSLSPRAFSRCGIISGINCGFSQKSFPESLPVKQKENQVAENVRPTKKQRELLGFIEAFIAEHGYSPSYREIMNGLQYTSVATVSLHVNSLIKRGHLRKRDYSARSLEVVHAAEEIKVTSNHVKPSDEKWLVDQIEHFFVQIEQQAQKEQAKLDELYVLIGTLRILGFEGAAQSFIPRLTALKDTVQ